MGLNPGFYAQLDAAANAMKADGLGALGITDGWRSPEEQARLHAENPQRFYPEGQSNHQYRDTADLKMTPEQTMWMKANAARFGLKMPAPSKEPWHVQSQVEG